MGERVWNGREWGSWTDGLDQQWIPDGESSADPALWQGNLAAILGKSHPGLYSTVNSGGSGDAAQFSNEITPEFQQWLEANGNSLSGTYLPGEGILQANVTDSGGNKLASETYANPISWAEFLAPVLMAATAGGAGSLLGSSVGLSGNVATAVGNGLMASGVTALDGGSFGDAVKSGLLAGGASYAGSGVSDALKSAPAGLDAAQQVAGAVDTGSSLSNFVDTPISVGAPDYSALTQLPEFSVGQPAPSWWQQAADPITVSGMPADAQAALQSVPEFSASVTPSTFSPAKDSQAASQQLGITGDQAAAAATAPSGVNLVNAGGVMQTAPSLLDTIKTTGSDLSTWMKANPTLGKLLLSGAGSLLNTVDSGSGWSGGSVAYADPAKWSSSPTALNQGLLAPQVKQLTPQLPGLLGNANSGAWRFMKGQ